MPANSRKSGRAQSQSVALVAGASRGIGRAIALALAESGHRVVLCARGQAQLRRVRGEIARRGATAHVLPWDFSRIQDAGRLAGQVRRLAGASPDILVYAAGTTIRKSALDLTEREWDQVMELNLKGAAFTARAVAGALLAENRPGSLIFIASLLSRAARPTILPYTVSKAGISALVRALAVEWAQGGVRVNAIAPGYIKTDLTRTLYTNPDFSRWVREKTPLRRWGQPEDIAPVAVFLASAASRFITGQTIFVDGGWSAVL